MILVTGVNGQLGHDVCLELTRRGINNLGVDIIDFDLTNEKQTREYINKTRPHSVIHCAAYTAVDKAESERDKCYAVNVDGTRNIAKVCKDIDAKMAYISTDYVFDGSGDYPWEVDSPKRPINYYGLTKSQGEDEAAHLLDKLFIVRTSWVFGANGNNFVKTMLRLGAERDSVNVVNDQIGSPTYTVDLAKLLCDMIQVKKYGVYHATNEGYCSWYDFASEIMKTAGLSCVVRGISTTEYPTAAKRPANSRLSKKALSEAGFDILPEWKNALNYYISRNS